MMAMVMMMMMMRVRVITPMENYDDDDVDDVAAERIPATPLNTYHHM